MNPSQKDLNYLDETIHANMTENHLLALRWRLAADAAHVFLSQSTPNKILFPQEIPFAENLATLIIANWRLTQSLEHQKTLSSPHWLFATRLLSKLAYADEVQGVDGAQRRSVQEVLDASITGATQQCTAEVEFRKKSTDETKEPANEYLYWMARTKAATSLSFKKEIEQTTTAVNKYRSALPEAARLAQEAVTYFEYAQKIEATKKKNASIERDLTIYRWTIAAHAAAHAASLKIHHAEIALASNEPLSQQLKEKEYLAENVFLWRTQAAKASQAEEETKAMHYSLAAYWAEQKAEKASEYHARIIETKNKTSLEDWKKALLYAENAATYRQKALVLQLQKKEIVATRWKEAAKAAEHVASLWAQAALSRSHWNFFEMIPAYWSKRACTSEKKAHKKIFGILMSEVAFCIPEQCLQSALQQTEENPTTYSWLCKTWHLLQEAGVTCNMSTQIPTQGTAITLSISFHPSFEIEAALPPTVFLVDVVADGHPHPGAHLHLVQNKTFARLLPRSLFMPHWPQSLLMPRYPERASRFENVVFFGEAKNFAPELRSAEWHERLHRELGIHVELRAMDRWHDYSDVDGVLAIRDFSSSRHFHKPATKLYNAWLAGVPFIGGRDSAYKADGCPGKDYLVATSPEEVFKHLKQLKEDISFRTMLVKNGRLSGEAFTQEATLERWKKLIQETLPHLASQWQQKSVRQRRWFQLTQNFFCLLDRLLR